MKMKFLSIYPVHRTRVLRGEHKQMHRHYSFVVFLDFIRKYQTEFVQLQKAHMTAKAHQLTLETPLTGNSVFVRRVTTEGCYYKYRERGTGNGEPGTRVWELMYSGNPLESSKWRSKQKKGSKRNNLG